MNRVGQALIITGSVIGIAGGVFNAVAYHDTAIDLWLFANPFLLIWAIGYLRGWWNTKMSIGWIAATYAVYTVLNAYAVLMR